ncbi:hypothetical protein QJQ45_001866 [Haematococcus lacustris]|nr:hypothetical protein QJQ45_001866 [Haematococcus lacustris]
MDLQDLFMWSDGCAGQFKGTPALQQHRRMALNLAQQLTAAFNKKHTEPASQVGACKAHRDRAKVMRRECLVLDEGLVKECYKQDEDADSFKGLPTLLPHGLHYAGAFGPSLDAIATLLEQPITHSLLQPSQHVMCLVVPAVCSDTPTAALYSSPLPLTPSLQPQLQLDLRPSASGESAMAWAQEAHMHVIRCCMRLQLHVYLPEGWAPSQSRQGQGQGQGQGVQLDMVWQGAVERAVEVAALQLRRQAQAGGCLAVSSVPLALDVLGYAPPSAPLLPLSQQLLGSCLEVQLRAAGREVGRRGRAVAVAARHWLAPGRAHHLTLLLPQLVEGVEENEGLLAEWRQGLHRLLALPLNRPALRVASALPAPLRPLQAAAQGPGGSAGAGGATGAAGSGGGRLRDVHLGLQAPVAGAGVHLVQGSYEYWHYCQDRVADAGWGCAYRSLQTLVSWFRTNHFTSKPVPSHREIQQLLVKVGDKPAGFVGSSHWVGAVELAYVLDEYLDVSCKIITVNKGADIPSHARQLAAHFDQQGTPVMVGGGVLAYTLLGVAWHEATGEAAFLILDPHYTGVCKHAAGPGTGEDLRKIQAGSWVAWKRPGDSAAAGGPLFVADAFYNFLCPQRPTAINKNVEREVLNHRLLVHPNIVAFREGVCHRDLKLENILLDGRHAPQVKICDFGYSKSDQDSNPKSTVGTPAYIAPEVLRHLEYDGQAADVWSCGVTLYVMLVGAYPFEDPAEPNNFRSIMQRITAAQYVFPPGLRLSVECLDLVARMLRPDPSHRITVEGIRAHPWFRMNLPSEVADPVVQPARHLQSEEEIQHIVNLARTPAMGTPRRMDLSRDTLDSMHGHISTQTPSPQQGAWPTDKWHGPPTPQQQHAGVAGRQHTVTKYAAAMAAHQAANLAANQEAALQQEAQRAAHQAAAAAVAAQQQQGLKQWAVAQALKQQAVAQPGALQALHQADSPRATPPPRGGLSFNMRSPMPLEEPPPRRSQVYLDLKWARQRLRLYGAQDRALEQFFNKLEREMAQLSMNRHGRAKQLVVFFGAATIGTAGGWGADAVLRACRKVVCRPRGTDQLRGRVVLVDEHRTSRVSSAVNGQQPCEVELDKLSATRPAGWKPPAGQVDPRLVRPAWSQERGQPVRGMMWCPVVAPRKPPQAPRSSQAATQPAASQPGPSTPPPAKHSKPAAEPTKGKGKAAKAKPAPQPGRWVDRDCNAALNMQRIGESRWRPLELCYWPDQGALPAKGKEYPGLGYKRVRDKPPKAQEQQQQPAMVQ